MTKALSVFLVGLGLLALTWGSLALDPKRNLPEAPLTPVVGGLALLGGAMLAINPRRLY